ncbi:hypothetical protein [Streptomyces sp. NPDC002044]|uniref:hypothetical protein n=1 Tax=Streptomyces sp. NPDC002044 TaxID=3154662 RepID=UPI0033310DCD
MTGAWFIDKATMLLVSRYGRRDTHSVGGAQETAVRVMVCLLEWRNRSGFAG